jgi:taurine dioxygenase
MNTVTSKPAGTRGTAGADIDLDTLQITPLAGRIGAEITGLKLHADLPRHTASLLRRALLSHKVIFLRGQHHLDDAAQEALAPLFGAPAVVHPTVPALEGTRAVLQLDSERGGRANSWHTDVSFALAYPRASILRTVRIPRVGGDTVWANTATAYESLPAPLRLLANDLWAVHSNDYDYAGGRPDASHEDVRRHREVFASTVYETEHPLVHVHPETQERSLILGHFFKQFVGLSRHDSQHLFDVFQAHITRLENTVRWHWAEGDVAIWDNRATQHYAINDYDRQQRVMHRVTVAGEPPISIGGSRSVSRGKTTRELPLPLPLGNPS